MNLLQKHSTVAIGYFLIIAILGVLMRLFPIVNISANYKFLIHTHSHIALLGWIYTALTTLIYKLFLSNAQIEKKHKTLFWYTQITIVGMLITFPITGYALFSIIFSTLFIIFSYGFIWLFLKYTSKEQKKTFSYKLIRISLWYMVLSSIGPWVLGIVMNTLGNTSSLYKNAIYFYLHFQYNGWFIMALFGILFYLFEQQNIQFSKKTTQRFFWLMNSGVMLTFFISILWMKPHKLIYAISFLGAVLQLIGFVILLKNRSLFWKKITQYCSKEIAFSLKIVAFFFLIKLSMQLLGTLPYFANSIASYLDFIIGYIHWIFLGIVSVLLLAFSQHYKLINLTKNALLIYLIGFILTEILIFYKGFALWLRFPLVENYFMYLVISSSLILIAIAYILRLQLNKKQL